MLAGCMEGAPRKKADCDCRGDPRCGKGKEIFQEKGRLSGLITSFASCSRSRVMSIEEEEEDEELHSIILSFNTHVQKSKMGWAGSLDLRLSLSL